MIVHYLYVKRVFGLPAEANAPLVIDSDALRACRRKGGKLEMCLPVMALRSSVLGLQAVEIADDIFGNAGLADRARGRGLGLLGSNQGQFAGIEPVAPAVGALVHFDPAFGAEEVAVEFYAGAAGAFTLAGWVHDQSLVASDVEQGLSRGLMLFINLLHLEGIKPNPAATALAGVHGEAANLQFG